MTDTPPSDSAQGALQAMGWFSAGVLPSFLATAVLPSVGIAVTIAMVALTTAKVEGNPPALLDQLLLAVILLTVLAPNGLIGLIGLWANRRQPMASILSFLSGFSLGLLAGLATSVVVGFMTWFITMTLF